MSNEHKKMILWWSPKEGKRLSSKKTVRNKIRKLTHEDFLQMAFESAEENEKETIVNTIVEKLVKELHWPLCKMCTENFAPYDMFICAYICEDNFAPYDHTICKLCNEAMDRLKK